MWKTELSSGVRIRGRGMPDSPGIDPGPGRVHEAPITGLVGRRSEQRRGCLHLPFALWSEPDGGQLKILNFYVLLERP
ncbi:hypothetical protein NL676_010295 [Syzygium grande]|nr:hypothetical protein NL676_010295 [Syzygium grande]